MFSKIFKKQLNFKPHRRFRPVLEALEDRCLPSILPVMNTSDSGVNGDSSLRGEILAAKNGDTIEFANNIGTDIHLLTVKGELPITQNITIQGPGAAKMTVHGSSHRVFEIAAGSTVTIQGLTITEGNPIGDGTPFSSQGGGILNHGNLTLKDDILKNNTALAGSNDDGQGGGVYNDDLLEMDNVQFLENNAIGGDKSGIAGNGQGGGLFNAGQVFIFHCTFDDNLAQGGNALADMGGFAGAGNGEGGGLFNYTFGSVSIFNQSLFEHNFARGGVAEALSAFNGGGEGGGVANDSGSFESVGTTYHFNHAIAGVSDTHDNSVPGTGFGGGLANFDGIMSLLGDVLDSNDADGGSAFGDGFSGGNAQGGGLYTAGGVVELDALLEQNAAEAGGGGKNSFGQGGEGGAALGGGVFSNGTDLNVIQSHFLNNVAVAGMGGDGPVAGGPGGLAQGGGLYLYDDGNAFPSLDAKFDMNQAIGGDSGHKGFGGDAQGGAIYLAKGNLSFTPTTSFTFNGAQGGRGREGETSGATDTPPTSGGFGGNAQGGALYIAVGDVRINHNSFQMNTARGGLGGTGGLGILAFPGGNGGRAEGGAVYQAARPGGAGFLDVRGALFLLNSAFGGDAGPGANGQSVNGGAGGMGGYAQAGGLFAADGLFIKDSLFFRNDADGGFGGSGGDSQGGAGGSGGAGAEADGGGISLSSATATMENVYVLGSIAQGGFGGKGGNGNGAGGSGGNGGFAAAGGLNIVGGVAIITTMTLSNSNLFGGLGGDGGAAQQSGMGGDGGNGGSVLGAGIFSSFSELGLVNGTVSVDGASGGSGGLGGLNGIHQRGDGGGRRLGPGRGTVPSERHCLD